jgi:GTP-binding nuclear protein Ran
LYALVDASSHFDAHRQSNPPPGNKVHEFKVALVGDRGVGKTTFLKRHMCGEFETKYVPTDGVEIHPVEFYTSRGMIRFSVFDTAGEKKPWELREGYYADAHCAIIMFDVTSRTTFTNVAKWHRDVVNAARRIPIVVVGSKMDERDHKVKREDMAFKRRTWNVSDYFISTKPKMNFERPFLCLARQLLKDNSLEFLLPEPPAERPPKRARVLVDDETKADSEEAAAGDRPDDSNSNDDDADSVDDAGAHGE